MYRNEKLVVPQRSRTKKRVVTQNGSANALHNSRDLVVSAWLGGLGSSHLYKWKIAIDLFEQVRPFLPECYSIGGPHVAIAAQ